MKHLGAKGYSVMYGEQKLAEKDCAYLACKFLTSKVGAPLKRVG